MRPSNQNRNIGEYLAASGVSLRGHSINESESTFQESGKASFYLSSTSCHHLGKGEKGHENRIANCLGRVSSNPFLLIWYWGLSIVGNPTCSTHHTGVDMKNAIDTHYLALINVFLVETSDRGGNGRLLTIRMSWSSDSTAFFKSELRTLGMSCIDIEMSHVISSSPSLLVA